MLALSLSAKRRKRKRESLSESREIERNKRGSKEEEGSRGGVEKET